MILTLRPYSRPLEPATGSYATARGSNTSRRPAAITRVEVVKSSVTPSGTAPKSSRRIAYIAPVAEITLPPRLSASLTIRSKSQ